MSALEAPPGTRAAAACRPASLPIVAVPAPDAAAAAPLRPRRVAPAALEELIRRAQSVQAGSVRLQPAPSGAPSAPAGQAVEQAVTGVTLDSRAVRTGDLYAALPGARVHGADFIAAAAAAGAVAVLTDAAGGAAAAAAGLPALVAGDPRAVLGDVAAAVYGDPTRTLLLLGVTGTNGKTTVCYLLEAGLRAAGHATGLVGTIETCVGGESVPSARTTPEAPDLQALFATMLERGVDAAAMEVSSHALALHRVDACTFAAAGFTNLSQDHLDFHPTMADYLAAKATLFAPDRCRRAVVNIDDPAGRTLLARRPDAVTVGVTEQQADWSARDVVLGPEGSTFRLVGSAASSRVDAPVRLLLPGGFNVSNALVALAVLVEAGVDIDAAVHGIGRLTGVPGRMERVDAGQPWLGIVDYAHTPQAVTTLLGTVRGLTRGRVLVVLGCGGDRDRGKRPLMGAAAAAGADVVVLTSDNPRSEDPLAILEAMRAGISGTPGPAEVLVEPDRAAAIALAVAEARPGDAVVVAGKGHETGQDVGGVITPFDDRVVLRSAVTGLAEAGR